MYNHSNICNGKQSYFFKLTRLRKKTQVVGRHNIWYDVSDKIGCRNDVGAKKDEDKVTEDTE